MNVNAVDQFGDTALTSDRRGRHPALAFDMLVEGFDHDVLDIGCGNAGDRSDFGRLRFSMQARQRDIIAIPDAGLGCMRRRHAVAASSNNSPVNKWSLAFRTCVPDIGSGGPVIRQLSLDRIEQGTLHDWWLLPRQDVALVLDLADIEAVAQEIEQRSRSNGMPPRVPPVASCLLLVRMLRSLRSLTRAWTPLSSR